jgi:hypothetical protein
MSVRIKTPYKITKCKTMVSSAVVSEHGFTNRSMQKDKESPLLSFPKKS